MSSPTTEDEAMKDRTARILLASVGLLLVAHLLRSATMPVAASAEEAETVPAVLRARMIELVDEQGQIRANLKMEPGGEVVFRLRDAEGKIRVKLGAAQDGSGLLLLDDRTEPAVQMLAKRAGTTVTLAEKGKENRVIKP
jgi:hypothetical protein